jgi:hypothetical protein
MGRIAVSDREIKDAVSATEGEMLELLSRLVEAPTTLGNEEPGQVIMAEAFGDLLGLEPPVYSVAYRSGMGTLYTAVYRPGSGSVEHRCPGVAWEHSFERVHEGRRAIRLLEPTAA